MAYVSINGHVIRSNARNRRAEPPIRIARTRSDPRPRYARSIKINGPSSLIYDPMGAILKCGARLVLEADLADIEIVN